MRAAIVRSVLVLAVGGLVLAGVLFVASTVDARPPHVVDIELTQPLPDASDAALITTSIVIEFSEPVEHESAVGALSFDPPVDGSGTWSATTLIFTPDEPLELETEYTLVIGDGVRDLAGNEMTDGPGPFRFATAGRPDVVETEPVDGSADVPVDAVIGVAFSTLMDTASVEEALDVRPRFAHELRWAGERLEIVPESPLRPARDYTVTIGAGATDAAGVPMAESVSFGFRTVSPGLAVASVVPAAGVDGVAPATPIAVIFDRPIDPGSVGDELFEVTPEVAGSIQLIGDADDPTSLRVLRFMPSAPLPVNTTFEVTVHPDALGEAGEHMAEPQTWSFTTGAPQATLSNQVLFISERAGVANVWAMNPDGTGQRQVSAELAPVIDYAVAPNGSSLVVADGRRLVHLMADGSGRQVMTGDGHLEFDPAFSPDGERVAFGRAEAETGAGLGLWEWQIGAAGATQVVLPAELAPRPTRPAEPNEAPPLRTPRYAPDGQALAFVDRSGSVGVLELPRARLLRSPFFATSPPTWLPTSDRLLVTGVVADGPAEPEPFRAPVLPLEPDDGDQVGVLHRAGTRVDTTALGEGIRLLAVDAQGGIAYVDDDGRLRLADDLRSTGSTPPGLEDLSVAELAFGPGGAAVAVLLEDGSIERIELEDGERARIAPEGDHLRWVP